MVQQSSKPLPQLHSTRPWSSAATAQVTGTRPYKVGATASWSGATVAPLMGTGPYKLAPVCLSPMRPCHVPMQACKKPDEPCVLVAAPSNVAVDQLAQKVAQTGLKVSEL